MRRSAIFVSAALLLTGGLNIVFGQRGGGHASGGHSAGSSGFHASSTVHTHSGSYGTGSGVYPTSSAAITASGINPGVLPTGPFRTGRRPGYGTVGRPGYGYGINRVYGYGYYPAYPLFDDYDYTSSAFFQNSPYQTYSDPSAQGAEVTANLLGEQVQQLSADVQALRDERGQQYTGPMARPRYNAPPMMQEDQTPSSTPLTLVMQDGKRIELKSYAVMGKEIWDFSGQPARKISMANVNLAASQKATEDAGGEFPELH